MPDLTMFDVGLTYLLLVNVGVLSASFFLAGLVELLWPGLLPASFTKPISFVINEYLEWKHPVFDAHGKRTKIPSCPYVWPNGQGDAAKFLSGIENSAAWEKQHGGVYRIWSGMKPEIVLTRPRQLQVVFRDSDKHSKAPANNSGFYMDQLLGQCVGLISGREWRAVRAVTEPPFRHAAVALQLDAFRRHVADHFAGLHGDGAAGNLARGLLHPVDDLAMLPFRVVADMFYGPLPPRLRADLEALVPLRTRLFAEHVVRGGVHRFSWARLLPTAANAELAAFRRAWAAFNRDALAHARRREASSGKGGGPPPPPIVAMFDAVDAGDIGREQLLQTLDESLFANLDVTAGGLAWVPVFLAAHHDAQRRLRAEVAGAEEEGGWPRGEYLLDNRSTYLAACVVESSRLRPLAAFSVPQAAPTRRLLDGAYAVPAGTSFVVDAYALNVRHPAWGPDNEAFRPGRFLDATDRDARDRRYLFWRFGFGPRRCMGRHAADLVIRMAVAHLVRHYDLDMLPGDASAWARSRESWITHPDFKLRCVRREEVMPRGG